MIASERALAREPDALVVGGGDGTIGCATQLLATTRVALGIVPLGTMNKLARDLGVPLDRDGALSVVAQGAVRAIDVGEVNGHAFLRNSFLGFPAHLAERRERARGDIGLRDRWAMAVALVRSLRDYPALPLRLSLPGRERHLRTRMLAVANNPYAEGFGRILDKASVDAGELVLYVAPRLRLGMFLRLALGMMSGTWRGMTELEAHHVRSLEVGSWRRRLRVMNDGEPLLLDTPLRYRILPRALFVIAPTA